MANEIEAMGQIQTALVGLDEDELRRVLTWAVDRFAAAGIELPSTGSTGNGGGGETDGGYQRIADLMDAASPSSVAEYVLVGTYWFQHQGQEDVTGRQVNSELKDLGHGSKNITDSFNTLINRKPPLARQVAKGGAGKQAQKRYRLTAEGMRAAEQMIAGPRDD